MCAARAPRSAIAAASRTAPRRNDGYDLVEWLAHQPFSDGKVGMVGCFVPWRLAFQVAPTAPPSLKAAFIGASDLDKYAFVRNGGITAQFNTRPDEEPAVDLATVPMDEDRDGAMLRAAVPNTSANTPMGPLWYGMPYRDSASSLTGTRFWEEVGPYTYLDTVSPARIATYFWGNWRDEPTSQIPALGRQSRQPRAGRPRATTACPRPGSTARRDRRILRSLLKGGIRTTTACRARLTGSRGSTAAGQFGPPTAAGDRLAAACRGSLRQGVLTDVNAGREASASFTVDYDLPPADYFAFWPQPMNDHGASFTSDALCRTDEAESATPWPS
jgi:hypothetical protein